MTKQNNEKVKTSVLNCDRYIKALNPFFMY